MMNLNDSVIQEVLAVIQDDPEEALRLLKEAAPKAKKKKKAPRGKQKPIRSTLDGIKKVVRGKKPDPRIQVVIQALMLKYGYNVLSKLIAKIARKMNFRVQTSDIEVILNKYGEIVVPIMTLLLVELIVRYKQYKEFQKDPTIPDEFEPTFVNRYEPTFMDDEI